MAKYFQTNPLNSPTKSGNYYKETSVRITCPNRVSKQEPSLGQSHVIGQVGDGESSRRKDKDGEGECEDTEYV